MGILHHGSVISQPDLFPDHYLDECPETPDAAYFEPDAEDRRWWASEPTRSAPASIASRTPIHLHVVAVAGTALGYELRKLLRAFGYCPMLISDLADFVGANGTATGSTADEDTIDAVNALLRASGCREMGRTEPWASRYDSDDSPRGCLAGHDASEGGAL